MHTVEYFMWGYQRNFSVSAQTLADSVFNLLDKELKPKIFLVGFLAEEREDAYHICTDPEDCGYDPDFFLQVVELAAHFEAINPERNIAHAHPLAQSRHEEGLRNKALRDATLDILRRYDAYYNVISFCSLPILVQGYKVCVVIQFDIKTFSLYYELTQEYIKDPLTNQDYTRYYVPKSLIYAVIDEYFNMCYNSLITPNPGSSLSITSRDPDEIIRAAGKAFMKAIGYRIVGMYGYTLWEACNEISSMRYEGAEGIGSMLISRSVHPNIEIALEFSAPIDMRRHRAVRKLLEISSKENSILTNASALYGIGKMKGSYDQQSESLFSVDFLGHYTWELKHGDYIMMRVSYKQPSLPKPLIDKNKFIDIFQHIFRDVHSEDMEKIWNLIIEAAKQKHGTMLVVSSEAEQEAERLADQAIRIKPMPLTSEMTKLITTIDGAVLINKEAICYAIGVILDGSVSKKGNSSRGSRYNSAIRYVEGRKECLAVVVSVDGMIDLVPDLMPRIKKSSISDALDRIQQIHRSSEINIKDFNGIMRWFENHAFYLDIEVCQTVNRLRSEIQDRIPRDVVRIVYDDFKPNEDMDETYFLEE